MFFIYSCFFTFVFGFVLLVWWVRVYVGVKGVDIGVEAEVSEMGFLWFGCRGDIWI